MKYLIIGAGVAGISAVREIIKYKTGNDSITVITNESYPFYYRPRLIECLSGEVAIKDIIIHEQDWFDKNDISFRMEETVELILEKEKKIITNKNEYSYDKLLIANGAHCFVPPIKGKDMKNIFALRDAADVKEIRQAAKKLKKAVVVGGGLLGLESAYNLKKSGLDVTVIEIMPRLLPRQLDVNAAEVLSSLLKSKGLEFYLDRQVDSFLGEKKVSGVKLKSGEVIAADMVLVSAGIRPNISLVQGIENIKLSKGIVVNEYMETTLDGIYAAGDIAEYKDRIYGIWAPAQQQGKIAGLNMAGEKKVFNPPVPSHKLKVVGINVISLGELDFDLKYDFQQEDKNNRYRKVVYDKQNNPIGAIIVGDFEDNNKIVSAIK